MERSAYEEMAAIDEGHWWYRARRTIVGGLIARHVTLPPQAQIVEIGCGTGSNLPVLARFGELTAIEPDALARTHASTRANARILEGYLPNNLPIDAASVDLAVMLDVLEHVDDDVAALLAVRSKLKADGRYVLTVPALPALWSPHDEEHHHKRRYTAETLRAALEKGGFEIELMSYFNTLLLPLIAGIRWMKNLTGSKAVDTGLPPAWLNGLLERIFAFELHLIGRVPLPLGVSLIAVTRLKPH